MELLKSNFFLIREVYLEVFEIIMIFLKMVILILEKFGVNFGFSGVVYDQ